jgi:hypothetical protein
MSFSSSSACFNSNAAVSGWYYSKCQALVASTPKIHIMEISQCTHTCVCAHRTSNNEALASHLKRFAPQRLMLVFELPLRSSDLHFGR